MRILVVKTTGLGVSIFFLPGERLKYYLTSRKEDQKRNGFRLGNKTKSGQHVVQHINTWVPLTYDTQLIQGTFPSLLWTLL